TLPREVRESKFATKFADLDEEDWIEVIAHYLGLVALADRQVGRILERLKATGEFDRTIVVFTTDHGDLMGAHRLMEKGHLLHYEEALRIPLLVRHPDASRSRTDNLVSVVDIAGTVAELAGVPWHEEDDGISFAHMLGASRAAPIREHVTAETVLYGMEADANGEYVDPRTWDASRDAINLSVRTPSLRYVYRSRDIDELYDHRDDPGEQHNRATDPAYRSERERLRALLADEVRDTFPTVAEVLTTEGDSA
ncbi:MAG TPA: sulfatase-like hydrolase/transferase, partial [Actinopolymorphaceae bacterium]